MMEFAFQKKYVETLGDTLVPIIPIKIKGPKEVIPLFMLIDSGADISLIPFSIGEYIGLEANKENHREIRGIGDGSIPYISSQVEFQIQDFDFSCRVAWALTETVPFILGRLDVFQNLSIEFREFENKILLKPQTLFQKIKSQSL